MRQYTGYDVLADYIDVVYPHDDEDTDVKLILQAGEELYRQFGEREISLLDLCCGSGRGIGLLSSRIHIKAVGVDQNQNFVSQARKKYQVAQFHCFNILDELRDKVRERFDCITMFQAINHYSKEEREKLFEHIHEMLNDDGLFVFDTQGENIKGSSAERTYIRKSFFNGSSKFHIMYEFIFKEEPDYSTQVIDVIEVRENQELIVERGRNSFFNFNATDIRREIQAIFPSTQILPIPEGEEWLQLLVARK